ncbi:MAG: endonuclease Q family protein, partial [Candidatus Daviesbacteria bacterium]|nr:endonuclease Q family protein [Candidatus Daviesbacteria bacterium]
FVLTVEVASIYSHKGAVRRIHNVIMLPSFESVEKLQKALLAKHAKLSSDGRPIVGISSKDLLKICLEIDQNVIFIPAHIWTPWFGVFGSQSGYDSLEDCFEDLTEYIYAIETGLSSDPAMNWRIKELDNRSIISCSDAHSLPNLGREATVFGGDVSSGYSGLFRDIKEQKIAGTIEFYPEEGKYHYTGHRNCNVKYAPEDTKAKGTKCQVCGRGLTVGVMERVEDLAGRSAEELGEFKENGVVKGKFNRPGYRKLVPLLQIIAEAFETAPTTQKVLNEYKKLTNSLGNEIKLLTKVDIGEIAKISGPKIAEGVEKVRRGDLVIDPGYDGVYGVVKIWDHEKEQKEEDKEAPQLGLFD